MKLNCWVRWLRKRRGKKIQGKKSLLEEKTERIVAEDCRARGQEKEDLVSLGCMKRRQKENVTREEKQRQGGEIAKERREEKKIGCEEKEKMIFNEEWMKVK